MTAAPQIRDDLVQRIATAVGGFPRSEGKVAEIVLSNPDGIVHQTIAQVAHAARVSQPTVLRFCRRVGCPGFQAFKVDLARSVGHAERGVHQKVQIGDDTSQIIDKICRYSHDSLERLRAKLDRVAVTAAIAALSQANKIEFYGAGASGLVAMDAHDKFFRLGIPCVAYTDTHQQIVSATGLQRNDVVVVFSHTGRTRDLVHVAGVAADQGAVVIGVTAGRSPLSKQCTICIHTHVDEDNAIYTPAASRLMQIVIVDILAAGLALQRRTQIAERAPKIISSLGYLRLPDQARPAAIGDGLQPVSENRMSRPKRQLVKHGRT